MDHTHIEQSFGDDVMTQIPEAQQVLQDLGIRGTHTRLQIQAEASSLDTDTLLAAMEMLSRRNLRSHMPDSRN
ncbi:MAG: hypothetical protein RL076_845 [Chloroflexota bacterium]|jgi:hypothetical protein